MTGDSGKRRDILFIHHRDMHDTALKLAAAVFQHAGYTASDVTEVTDIKGALDVLDSIHQTGKDIPNIVLDTDVSHTKESSSDPFSTDQPNARSFLRTLQEHELLQPGAAFVVLTVGRSALECCGITPQSVAPSTLIELPIAHLSSLPEKLSEIERAA